MNDIQLKYFNAVCEFESVSKAAEFLHISQPSLSNAIKQLETEVGVELFIRRYRGVSLTKEGSVLRDLAKDILSRIKNAENIMKDMGNGRKTLRLGIPPMIGSVLLPDIYREFICRNTDLLVEFVEGGRYELLDKLNEDYLDMVILPHNVPFDKEYAYKNIASLEIMCCVSTDSRLSTLNKLSPEILSDVPVVLLEDTYFHTGEIKKWFSQKGIKPKVVMQTGQLSTMLKMISEGITIGFVFGELVDDEAEFRAVPMENPIKTEVSLVWKKNSHIFSGMSKFLEYMEFYKRKRQE